ncbi:hypothetical protein JTB14_003754 [Gonioctena quinquepunctata]|nr:hypothetical protein JTB14_003754 [Gonioctena quinquepunctata]
MSLLKKALFLMIVIVLLVNIFVETATIKRSKDFDMTTGSSESNDVCVASTPCGWAVYNKTNRMIDYFLENKCVCEGEQKCIRKRDDLSIAALAARCSNRWLWTILELHTGIPTYLSGDVIVVYK